jgi:Thiamine pyrophosphate enzyme, C-terminal TPP binding domain
MHPYRVIAAINERLTSQSVVVADGGDILSFARVGVRAVDYLDCGALGCLGVGVPFAIAAALQRPGERVVAIVGDGSFGFTAMEIDTAVRHNARALFVIANNEAWNIERHDQVDRYDNLVGVELPGCRYDEVARSLGAYAERVDDQDELGAALDRALAQTPRRPRRSRHPRRPFRRLPERARYRSAASRTGRMECGRARAECGDGIARRRRHPPNDAETLVLDLRASAGVAGGATSAVVEQRRERRTRSASGAPPRGGRARTYARRAACPGPGSSNASARTHDGSGAEVASRRPREARYAAIPASRSWGRV